MGASVSHRPSKCLKARSKSEECLAKSHLRRNMGRFFAHVIRDDNEMDDRYWKQLMDDKVVRSNSLDKNSFQCDGFAKSEQPSTYGKLTIDVDKDLIFEVNLRKGSRGLGFSILEYDGFIFIKQLFPLDAASQSGMLQEGDIILSANGITLTDLSSFEALQVLRKLQNPITLVVCRLHQFINSKPVSSSQNMFANAQTIAANNDRKKEFEIKMTKINGSLGFTLKKDGEGDDCCHVIRALVKEPAISDGRIKPNDKIISVNGIEIANMSHQEAVKYLRDCGSEVSLMLLRDTMSLSLTSLNSSHSELNNKTLRKEALDMLSDLAGKKLKIESEGKEKAVNSDDQSFENFEHDEVDADTADDSMEMKFDKKDSLFGSRENFSMLKSEEKCKTSFIFHDADHLSNDLGELADEPVSLPALDINEKPTFHHNDPAYHSMNVPNLNTKNDFDNMFSQTGTLATENKGLLKWKGIVLDSESENDTDQVDHQDFTKELITVQLQRNWNSRLGFSLCQENGSTIIRAIHADSVASTDGRLKINDKLVQVNNKNVEHMDTNEVIELLRNVRGTVTIIVSRNKISR